MSSPQTSHWERAQEFLRRGQVQAAARELQSLQLREPAAVRTRLLAAQVCWHEGRLREASTQALAAADTNADADVTDPEIGLDLIATLRLVGETARAHAVFRCSDWQKISSPGLTYQHALVCQGFGDYERALAAFDRLSADAPDDAYWHFFRGQQLEFLGRFEHAQSAYETCLDHGPGFGYAAYKLARLRSQSASENLLPVIDTGLRHVQPGTSGRADFEFARYHVLEAMGRTDVAWQALRSANNAMRTLGLSDVAAEQAALRDSCARMAAQRIPTTRDMPTGPCPIFIIGMPRSGTTLLERMLANHSQVAGAGELTDFGHQVLHVLGHHDLFAQHSSTGVAAINHFEVGRRYLLQTAWRAAGKAYFTDKQPTNWMMVGLIRAALPQARILHLVRDPMDTCFSLWRARFADGHLWTCELDALAAQFACYQKMMRHWKQRHPDAMLEVDYAELVNHPQATLRGVMAFCGLPWEPGCEDPSSNPAPVATLSSSQVRQPVNKHGLGRWRRYANQLAALQRQLAGV